ncbi:bile acid:sodium symporter family protein [Phytohabitans rumicis]|uniref:Bile acid:sodium symporter n=1 Tax=Phytohabitans rumicis TaxID=1076125 RepID=A0A6V8LI20_9ACTN|nr:bile acid:sodium symporter family protein [Phytohabitans rumicis]GFJ94508.1 bile acid:sodium symporter [Phytohabitans rumicis]
MASRRRRLGSVLRRYVDAYLIALLAVVGVAALLPARGAAATAVSTATTVAVGLLFFLYGARIKPAAAWAGAKHWRLHAVVLLSTFALFPLLALALAFLPAGMLTPALYDGLVFLSVVPSTVQSSIAFTSIAGGNVPAAIFSASFSNLAGVVVTPLLAAVLLGGAVAVSAGSIGKIVAQLVLPFAAGQALRPWIGGWMERRKRILGYADRGAILLVIYAAFSAGVVAGVWHEVSPGRLLALVGVLSVLLALVLGLTYWAGRLLGFDRPDRVTAVFCGSKKSMATGLPMATVLFTPASVGLMVLPLMLFHQIQLVVCAVLARRWASP